jgi:hypothetical protein
VSAASVAVIYAYRRKTARAEWKIFSIFLQSPMSAGDGLINRVWKTGMAMMRKKGEGRLLKSERVGRASAISWISPCAFSGLWKQFDGCHGFVSKPA